MPSFIINLFLICRRLQAKSIDWIMGAVMPAQLAAAV